MLIMDKIMLIKITKQTNFIGNSGGFCWLRLASLVPETLTISSKVVLCQEQL